VTPRERGEALIEDARGIWDAERLTAKSDRRTRRIAKARRIHAEGMGLMGLWCDLHQLPEFAEHDPTARRIILVACSAGKGRAAAPARDLYTGDLFRKARAYAEAFGSRWFILSALHGLLDPSTVVAPYNVSLDTLPKAERDAWGARVFGQLRDEGCHTGPLVVLAGALYWDSIRDNQGRFPWLRDSSRPLARLGIGRQKAWLKAAVTTQTEGTDR
jgi:hypothetical protein